MGIEFTSEQQAAIQARGQSILVNAGAGAGKTATLVERVYRLMVDEQDSVPLDRMLIVTFTRAAAAEMRERLAKKLREAIDDAYASGAPAAQLRLLRSQLNVLPRAQISTLHSFCLKLLRDHATQLGLPPDFDLMPEEEAILIHRESLDAAIQDGLVDEECSDTLKSILAQLSPTTGGDLLEKQIRSLHHFLQALADPDAWVAGALELYREAADFTVPFEDCRLAARTEALIFDPLDEYLELVNNTLRACPVDYLAHKSYKKYRTELESVGDRLGEFLANVTPDTPFPNIIQLTTPPRRSSAKKDLSATDERLRDESLTIRTAFDDLKSKLVDIPEGATINGYRESIANCLPYLETLLGKFGLDFLHELQEHHLGLRRLTYAHLERLAMQLLAAPGEESKLVADKVRSQFDVVLVDEFQDVNELQSQLLKAVSRQGDGGTTKGNLFAVGDMKQSIYGFRQADPLQFLAMYHRYQVYEEGKEGSPGARINLSANFRTTPLLLDEINKFFEKLFSPEIGQIHYDENHRLVAGVEAKSKKPCFEVYLIEADVDFSDLDEVNDVSFESAEREADFIARRIAQLKNAGTPYGDCAILLRSASGYAAQIVDALDRASVPFFTQESLEFLLRQEVSDVLSILKTIANPYDEVSLVGALRGPVAEWSEDDLARLRLVDRQGFLFDILKGIAGEESPLSLKAEAFLEQIRTYQELVRHERMELFFSRLYDDLALVERVSTLPNGDQRVRNLHFLQQRAAQFDGFRRKGIRNFLSFIEDLLDRSEDLGQPPSPPVGTDVVRIMTVHKSKGLEFPTVFVPFLGKRFNFADVRDQIVWDHRHGIAVRYQPNRKYGEKSFTPALELLCPEIEKRLRSEELRLLYVAMTRAKERLVLSGSRKKVSDWFETSQEAARLTKEEREAAVAKASTALDWVSVALQDRAEWKTTVPAPASLSVQVVSDAEELSSSEERSDSTKSEQEQVAALQAKKPLLEQMLVAAAESQVSDEGFGIRVKVSATEAKRAHESIHWEENPPAKPLVDVASEEESPAWWPKPLLGKGENLGARRRGTLVHRFCALIDLDAIYSGVSVKQELERLTAQKYFTEEEQGQIDCGQIEAFFEDQQTGKRMLQARATVRREIPFLVQVTSADLNLSEHPNEKILFQGVIDALFEDGPPDDKRLVLVDFKTDRWYQSAKRLMELEDSYTPQLSLYSFGIERSFGRPVAEAWLYFLDASQPIQVDVSSNDWKPLLASAVVQQS